MENNFCVFILTHGRPDRVHTYDHLMKAGYTGKVFIVIDDEDKTEGEYRKRFGDKVLQFCKKEWAEKTDEGDNFNHRKAIVYARNACWELAKQVGCEYFVQFDDDYTEFDIRYDSKLKFQTGNIKQNIDAALTAILDFYKSIPATAIAFSQGGDHIGGGGDGVGKTKNVTLRRKCMNSWFCNINKPFKFVGHMNEDVSAYVLNGLQGHLFFTVMQMMIKQKPTQTAVGGMSDLYLSSGTYVKSFYSVMQAPSCVKIGQLADPRNPSGCRIHHKINWHNACSKIIRSQWKKT